MHSTFQIVKKYLRYYITASNGKGHGTHSPFVFDFIANVLNDKKTYACYDSIESVRKQLKRDATSIEVADFGAGSTVIKSNNRVVKSIAGSSLKSPKFARLLFRIVQHYKPQHILELGTSFGITTAYLARGNPAATIFTCEGAPRIAAIARHNFIQLGLQNITVLEGDFAKTLPGLFGTVKLFDFAFVDGNHRKVPTLEYFQQLLAHSTGNAIFIFDDIHWSSGMEAAWSSIQQHQAVTLTIDLFYIGIVCINRDIKLKQHFTIRY